MINIGDKVRLLHSSEEGIVSKILNNNLIEVEIEDGFHIPIKRNEVVKIAREEASQFKPEPSLKAKPQAQIQAQESKQVIAQKGIYVGFVAINDQLYSMNVINNTDFDLPFTLGEEQEERYEGICADILRSREYLKVREVNIQKLKEWGVFIFQFLFFRQGKQPLRQPLIRRARFRPNTFFQTEKSLPIIGKSGYLFQVDAQENIEQAEMESQNMRPIDPVKLKESLLEPKEKIESKAMPSPIYTKPPKLLVDLHIEELTKDYDSMNSSEIINLQLNTFEKELENALAGGLAHITFIHGVGNGKLRSEIHKRLGQHDFVRYFEDAQKEKFGYGATKVTFK